MAASRIQRAALLLVDSVFLKFAGSFRIKLFTSDKILLSRHASERYQISWKFDRRINNPSLILDSSSHNSLWQKEQ
jgi:hypothetical protein